MDESGLSATASSEPTRDVARFRWWIHLVVLTLYPLALGFVGFLSLDKRNQPMLPTDTRLLLFVLLLEMALFAAVFAIAWAASRATASELLLRWKGGFRPVIRGVLYSIGLRIVVMVFTVIAAISVVAASGGRTQAIEKMRPQVEQLVDAKALVDKPVYFFLNLTVVSFVVAGLREELWRAGMLAGLAALFPGLARSSKGQWVAVTFAAIIFGLGHFTQGWGGVAMTTILGLGLGGIIVYQRSMWEAVLAHGFFNATTFVMVYGLARFQPQMLPGGHAAIGF